jgi:hypothetical protein
MSDFIDVTNYPDLVVAMEADFDPAKLVLRCIICTEPIPAKRARGRSKDTCGPECHAKLRAYRKWVVQTSKCPNCYHPATPEERADFKAWRKARGHVREKRGNPRRKAVALEDNSKSLDTETAHPVGCEGAGESA